MVLIAYLRLIAILHGNDGDIQYLWESDAVNCLLPVKWTHKCGHHCFGNDNEPDSTSYEKLL